MNKSLLLIPVLASTALASPRIDSNSLAARHDMLLLKDSGEIDSAVLAWPWPLGRNSFNDSHSEDYRFTGSTNRLKTIYETESQTGKGPIETRISFASDNLPFRSYGFQPREQIEATASQSWLSEWISGNLSLTYANDPADGDEFRLDGSYVSVALGNWVAAIDQVDRWWGPGWDGSLILSNNARPVPAISLTRISPEPYQSKWLKWIGPWTFTTYLGQLDNKEAPNAEGIAIGSNARLFGMRIDFSPFGWKNLDIGLSRTAQWAGTGRPGGWDTFRKLLVGEDNVVAGSNVTKENEPGNQLAGIDYRIRIPGFNFAHYFQIVGEDEDGFLPDANMIMGGIETWGALPSVNATWRSYFEWADTRAGYLRRDPHPYHDFNTAYNHGIYRNGYRRKGQAIGHAMDGDGVMRSIGALIEQENGNLWGAKYRNYSLNRDGTNPNVPHSVADDHTEGSSIEFFAELNQIPFFFPPRTQNPEPKTQPKLNLGINYSDEKNMKTDETSTDLGAYLSLTTSF